MKVWVVGMDPLDSGPEGSAEPEAAFSTEEAAIAWGRERGEKKVGRHYWWGNVRDADGTYVVWGLEVDAEHSTERQP